MNILSFAPGICPAKSRIIISCIIQFIPVMITDHPCTAGEGLLMTLYSCQHFPHKILIYFCIVIQKEHIRCPWCINPLIYSSWKAEIIWQLHNVYPGKVPHYKGNASIWGSIVHQNGLKILKRLLLQAWKHTLQICHPIIIGNNDWYFLHNVFLVFLLFAGHARKWS